LQISGLPGLVPCV